VLPRGGGRALAVFSIWGPADRVPPSRFEALGAIAMEAAASAERALRDLFTLAGGLDNY
jgi:DNA-binding IclR family transcriptional regulator